MENEVETTKEGSAAVFLSVLVDAGFIVIDKGNIKPGINCDDRTILLTGDRCTQVHITATKAHLIAKLADEKTSANAKTILKIFDRIHQLPGDLHVLMHSLDATYRLFYGGIIQAFQAALGWKRITRDPVPRFQASEALALLIASELERKILQQWAEVTSVITVKNEWSVSHPVGQAFDAEIPITELFAFEPRAIILALIHSLDAHKAKLRSCDDAVVRIMMEYHDQMEVHVQLDLALHCADSISFENGLIELLPYFKVSKKSSYADAVAEAVEITLGNMTSFELQEYRLNRFVLLNASKGHIGTDDVNEKQNLWTKQSRGSKDVKVLVKRSMNLCLLKRAHSTFKCWNKEDAKPPKSSVAPKDAKDREAVRKLLESCRALEDVGRVTVSDDFIWDHVAAVNASVYTPTPATSKATSPYSKVMTTLFGRLRTSAVAEQSEVDKEDADGSDDENEGVEADSESEGSSESGDSDEEGAMGDDSRDAARISRLEKRFQTMKRYPLHTCLRGGPVRKLGIALIAGIRAKRAALKAQAARERGQLDEAVALFEQRSAEARRSVAALRAYRATRESTDISAQTAVATPLWMSYYKSVMPAVERNVPIGAARPSE